MAKTKPIYLVWLTTSFGIGVQPVKANNQTEARAKFKKRYPKKRILDIAKADDPAASTRYHAI